MSNSLFLSTEMIEPKLRNEFWRAVALPLFHVLPTDAETASLEGTVRSLSLGELTLGSTTFNRQHYVRDRQIIVRGGLDHYLLQVLTDGGLQADCDGASVSAQRGDICLFDLARLYRCSADAGSRITLMIPRARIELASGGRSLHGLALRDADPMTRLLRGLIVDLHSVAAGLNPGDAIAMEAAVVDFLCAVIGRRSPHAFPLHSAASNRLKHRILKFIDAQIADPTLGPEMLMRHFQLSRAHLYRLLADDGGVATIIRNRRLDAAYRLLRGPASTHRSITEIAYDLGFASSSQFARAFRARFALAPSEACLDVLDGSSRAQTATIQSHLVTQAMAWSAWNGAAEKE